MTHDYLRDKPAIFLNECDKEIIAQQLINQEAETEEERENFTRAYAKAKEFALTQDLTQLTDEQAAELILDFAREVYPVENHFGLRSMQPTHGKTGEAIGTPPGRALEVAIVAWCEEFAVGEKGPDELYYIFETIHPFNDGNGRVGHLMWAIDKVRNGEGWPEELPPEYEDLAIRFGVRSI